MSSNQTQGNSRKWYQRDYFTQHKTLRRRFWNARSTLLQGAKSTPEGLLSSRSAFIETYLNHYYSRYFTWPWSREARRKRQEKRWDLIHELHAYETDLCHMLARSELPHFSTLARVSEIQRYSPWGLDPLAKASKFRSTHSRTQHLLYRYGLPFWRFSAYSLLALLLVTTAAVLFFLAVTGGLGAPIAQVIAQAASSVGLGSLLSGFLGLGPVVWLTAHAGLTFTLAALGGLFAALVHREIHRPGFYARTFNQYGHVIRYNIADWASLLASFPLLHGLLTLLRTPGDKGLRAYSRGTAPSDEKKPALTSTLHNIAAATPAPDETGHLVKWLFNPVRWLQSTLTFTFLMVCFISEGRTSLQAKSHPLSLFLKGCAATLYFPLYLALEPLKALCDIPYSLIDTYLVTPLENGLWQLAWRVGNKAEEKTHDTGPVAHFTHPPDPSNAPIMVGQTYFFHNSATPLNPVVVRSENPLLSHHEKLPVDTDAATSPPYWTPQYTNGSY